MTVPAIDTATIHQLNIRVPDLADFQQRYEEAVPPLPFEEVRAMVLRKASWAEMTEYTDSIAPNGFLTYSRMDMFPTMQLAGNKTRCVAYLMGNHIIVERMFRHDPRTMLHAPLRTVIWEHADGSAWFSIDQPSSHFSSLGIPEITQVGLELDRKIAGLLKVLEVEVPAALG